jgi:cell pole-organizing protein PopZ
MSERRGPAVEPEEETISAQAANAATASVQSLVGRLTQRSLQVHTGGPNLVDIVREELRPLVKEWLDANLPTLVERLVQAEIERVVSRIE